MKLLIGANFKMNKTISELREYLSDLKNTYNWTEKLDLMIAPNIALLSDAWKLLNWSKINLWAQNMFYEESWAYTWETSAIILKNLWCNYLIVWHSERRQYFGETNEQINKKIKKAIEYNIRPILCIWENLKQKELWITLEILKIQLTECLEWIDINNVDIAYEPVWAIWTWQSANAEYVEQIHNFLRELIWDNQSRIIYWWSVNEVNASSFIKIENVNWFLIGNASLDLNKFLKIIEESIK